MTTRFSETCTCQAGFTAEGDDTDRMAAEVAVWRARHRCGTNPHTASAFGAVSSQTDLGFRGREDWSPLVPSEPDEEGKR